MTWHLQTGDPNYDVSIFDFQSDPNYVAVSPMIQHMDISPDLVAEVAPFNDSWFMKNWQYDGVFAYYGSSSWYFFWLDKNLDPFGGYSAGATKYQFDGYTYVNSQTASLLNSQLTNNSFIYLQTSRPNQINSATLLTEAGLSWNGSQTTLASSYANRFGLAYQNVRIVQSQNAPTTKFDIATGGAYSDPISGDYSEYFQKLAAPSLTTVDYYFAQAGDRTDEEANTLTPMPNDGVFSVTNTTPLIITAVGQPATIYGWAKQSTAASGKYAYLGQYFDPTSATNGILSEYGDFMALQPGQFTLKTKLDGSSQGSCPVYAVSLNVDANHDGVMDLTYTGPDTTSAGTPFEFWVNDDNDGTGTGQEIESFQFPDYSYGEIRSQRGLEDFARLWICGVPSLPAGYTATLSCTALSGSPAINIYTAESGGGTFYLTDTNTAQSLVGETKLGTVSSSSSYTFSSGFFDGSKKYFLFEGAKIGRGQITLTISHGSTVIAQSSMYIDLHDVKDLYEQARIVNVTDTFPSSFASTYVEDHVLDPNPAEDKSLILFVHGWRMSDADYWSFSASMFKRLYWQGYHGRFASLRWPTLSKDDFILPFSDLFTYNQSEFRAWKSGQGVSDYLTHLKQRLPNYSLNVAAHSMGNVVVAEALKDQLALGQQNVRNYVLMQAAVPAHCYQTNLPNYSRFIAAETNKVTPDAYRGYPGAINSALQNKMFNFFNTNDFALATGTYPIIGEVSWEANETKYKPDSGYSYDGTNSYRSSTIITERREIMSRVARPRSKAVGALKGVSGIIAGGEVNLRSLSGFNDNRDEHSAEFNWNIQRLDSFYSTLLTDLQQHP